MKRSRQVIIDLEDENYSPDRRKRRISNISPRCSQRLLEGVRNSTSPLSEIEVNDTPSVRPRRSQRFKTATEPCQLINVAEPTTSSRSESSQGCTIGSKEKETTDPSRSQSPHPRTWTKEEIKHIFEPLFNSLNKVLLSLVPQSKGECIPFKANHPEILKLSHSVKSLVSGLSSPWDVVRQFYQLLQIDSTNLRSSTDSDNLRRQLFEVFSKNVDPVMRRNGFCCGQRYVAVPTLYCSSPIKCDIRANDAYYEYTDGQECHRVCAQCFGQNNRWVNISGSKAIFKDFFVKKWNIEEVQEEFIACSMCGREWHKYCALHVSKYAKSNFMCPKCKARTNCAEGSKFYAEENWPKNELSCFIQSKVNDFLSRHGVECGKVMIRVMSTNSSKYDIDSLTRRRIYADLQEGHFKYLEKSIFAFQESEGHYACFFGLFVQEYGKDSAEPNTDRVYISYLDSVPFFQPRNLRTRVYQEILCAYMEYLKMLDYKTVHIWSCPPMPDQDYIFHIHPSSQRIPDSPRLLRWYHELVTLAIEKGIVIEAQKLLHFMKKYCNNHPKCIPYFKGDFWSGQMEKIMEDLVKKEKEHNIEGSLEDQFWKKLGSEVRRADASFQVFTLRNNPPNKEVPNPDLISPVASMKDRDSFLQWCRDNELEFTSIRHARYSTLAIFYEFFEEMKKQSDE